MLGVHHCRVHVGEDLELVAHTDVIAVARHAVADHAAAHGLLHERLDHAMLECLPAYPMVRFYAHVFALLMMGWIECPAQSKIGNPKSKTATSAPARSCPSVRAFA